VANGKGKSEPTIRFMISYIVPARNTRMKIILVFFSFLFCGSLRAGQPFLLRENQDKSNIGNYLEYIEDEKGTINFKQILGANLKWQKSEKETLGFGFTTSVYWVRFSVKNTSGRELDWILHLEYPLIDDIALYFEENNRYQKIQTGDHYAFSSRPVKDRNFIFPFRSQIDQTHSIIIRFQTTSSMNIPLSIWSPEGFQEFKDGETPLLWMYYGFLLVMLIYNLFIYFSVKDISYLWYIIYIISFGLFMMGLNGFAFQYLWPNWVWFANYCIPLSLGLLVFSLAQFARHFLESWRHTRRLDTFLKFVAIAAAVAGFTSLLLENYGLSIRITAFLAAVALGTVLVILVMTVKKSRQARFGLSAFSLFLAGAVFTVLKLAGFVGDSFLSTYALQWGSAMEIVLLAIGLADRINVMKKELQVLNASLEQRVKERTAELKQAMEKLKETQKNLVDSEKKAALTQVSAGLAHELNNPLNYIAGGLPNLKKELAELEEIFNNLFSDVGDDHDVAEVKNFIDQKMDGSNSVMVDIETGVERVAKVIEEIRAMTEVDGRIFERIDLGILLKRELHAAKAALGKPLKGKKILAEFSVIKNLFVEGNPYVYGRVFRNVFKNALVYCYQREMPGIRIEVKKTTDKEHCLVSISNNGKPIDPKFELKIFDAFFTTRNIGEGRGTGLSIARSLLDNTDGEIILSDNGLESGWVTFAIRIALAREVESSHLFAD